MPLASIILGRKYRNIGRIGHIVQVFLAKGFGHFLHEMGLHRGVPFARGWKAEPEHPVEKVSVRLREAFEELGPTFIKFGQVLSGRPDLITAEYANEFRKLQDEVTPFPFEAAAKIIEQDLGGRLDAIFPEFEKAPVAAASIAQVHHATLPDGTPVAVKVRRPGIEKELEKDISILTWIAQLLEKRVPESRMYNPTGMVDEFAHTIRREINFQTEADNMLKFARNFKDSETVYIPKVYEEYSGRRVLTMERISGIRIDMTRELDEAGFDRAALAENGAKVFFKQIFEDGFFHADPHAGNMFVLPDGRIGLLDFGMVGRLTDENMEMIADTFLALVERDFDGLVRQYVSLGFVPEHIDLERFRKDFKRDLVELIDPLYGKAIGQIRFSDHMLSVTEIARRHGLRLPRELILVNKALFTIEGIGRELDPEFDFMAVARPYASRLVARKYSPRRYARRARRNALDLAEFMESLPRHLRVIFGKIKRDDVKVNVELIHLERFIKEFDRSTNRLSFALIIAGITIASALIIHSGKGRMVFGFPFLGFVGYLFAAFLGLWLIWGIVRSGRL